MSAPNYTVNGRIADLTSRVTELEAENKRLRVHLAGRLETLVNDAKNSFRDGAPGRDGESIVGPKGDKGERGDITVYGDDELREAVKQVRAELLRVRASVIGRILQGIADRSGTSSVERHFRKHLEKILRDIENL